MRIRLAIPDHLVTPAALEAALEATGLANAEAIRRGEIPHAEDAIAAGVKWKPEPFLDGEHFDLGHQVQARGWGDCDDLAPWLTGSLRASGEDEDAVTRILKTGKNRWHAVTQLSDGQIVDPSKWAGMGRKKSGPNPGGVVGMIARPFAHPGSGAMCVMPSRDGKWWSRADVPWLGAHLASHARGRTPDEALHRAVSGAIVCGESHPDIDDESIERIRDMARVLLTDRDELLSDDGQVGSLFGSILKVANPMSLLHPLTKKIGIPDIDPVSALKGPAGRMAANMVIPGAGGALHDSALSMLAHGGGRGGAPGAIRDARSGAVSVPLEAHARGDHDTFDPSGSHAMIFYHPLGAPGPVVVRI